MKITQKQVLKLYLLTIIILYVRPQSCIYAQTFKIFSSSTSLIPYSASCFDFPVTWDTAQPTFTNYSYYLVGFKMQTARNVLSFDAKITSISSTTANFYFKFESHSQIVYGQFGIILLKPCTGLIRLIHLQYYPTQLNQAVRSVSLELVKVYVDFTYGTATKYVISAILSSWKIGFLAAGHTRQIIQLIQKAIVAGRNYQQIEINSPQNIKHEITKIQATYLVFDRTTFTPALAYYKYNGRTQLSSSQFCLTVPLFFEPLVNYNCMVGITYIASDWITIVNTMQAFIDSGFINATEAYLVTQVNFIALHYVVICMEGCKDNKYVDYTSSTTTHICKNCNIAKCIACGSLTTCNMCNTSYFLSVTNSTCSACTIANCSICSSSTKCSTCQSLFFLDATNSTCSTCTIANCSICSSSTKCSACESLFFLGATNSTCSTCLDGECNTIDNCLVFIPNISIPNKCSKCVNFGRIYLLYGLCLDVIGCMVPKFNGNYTVCSVCNFLNFFKPTPINNTCICNDGTKNVGNKCEQICGDGKLFTLQCDDENVEDSDGCSSDCKIEDNFQCVEGSQTSPSRCIYQKYDIKLSLVSIDKVFLEDRGIFTFEISPFFTLFKHYNLYNLISFTCNQSSSVSAIYLKGSRFIIQVDFQEDLQTNPAHVTINFPLENFLQKSFLLDFNMISDGVQLIILHSKQKYKMYMYAFHIGSLGVLFLFAISLLTHKMIGLQLMRPFQIIYLVYLINEDRTPFFSVICFLSNTAYNYLFFQDLTWNIRTPIKCICFDEANYRLSQWIIFGSIIPSIIVLVALIAIRYQLNYTGSDDHKEDKNPLLSVVIKYFYHRMVFPLSMCTLLVFFIMTFTQKNQIKDQSTHIVHFFQLFTLSCIYFYEWKILFVKYKSYFQGIQRCDQCSIYLSIRYQMPSIQKQVNNTS